jgi:3-phosphoshikimate 1-carboxyvinyltransferase
MTETIRPARVDGTLRVPASKSHTIRALILATLADGESIISSPLASRDTRACIAACRALGAEITEEAGVAEGTAGRAGSESGSMPQAPAAGVPGEQGRPAARLRVRGTGGALSTPDDVIDVMNSGTTLYLLLGVAALVPGWSFFTGDAQIRRRSAAPLLQSLKDLGAEAFSSRDNGCAPVAVRGPLVGGRTSISCPTSQYLSSLLLVAPYAAQPVDINVPLLNERPYVEMTLWWLAFQGVAVERNDWARFRVGGGERYRAFRTAVPGDYSSATFPAVAAAVTGGRVTLEGLSPDDPQGDKAVLDILGDMGCRVERSVEKADRVTVTGPARLHGGAFDLNAIPDALPALTVAGCYADSPTTLHNVPQARAKETDRIAVMARELGKLGARIEERDDGLVVYPHEQRATPGAGKAATRAAALTGGTVSGHEDHRVVMALAVAGAAAAGPVEIQGAEAAEVTYPGFFDDLRRLQT